MPRIIDFSDGFETSSPPSSIGTQSNALSVYANDAAYESANGVGQEGDVYFNSTTNKVRIHDGVSWAVLVGDYVDLTSNQSIGGTKTFTGNVVFQGTTTTIDSTVTEIEDPYITLNNGGNDATAENAGLEIERTSTFGALKFDSALSSKWKCGLAGSESEILTVGSAINVSQLTGTLPETKGGTGEATYTAGDILYSDALNSLAKLPIGSASQVLTVSGGLPAWQNAPGGGGGTANSLETYTTDAGFEGANGPGQDGDIFLENDNNMIRYFVNGSWHGLSGAGIHPLKWSDANANAPIFTQELSLDSWKFGVGAENKLVALIRLPSEYKVTTQILFGASYYSPSTAGSVVWELKSYYLPYGTPINDTTDVNTDTQTDNSGPSANETREILVTVTSATGEINGNQVAPGDFIRVELVLKNTSTDTGDVRLIDGTSILQLVK